MLRSIPRRYYIDVHITIGLEVLCVTVQHIRVVDEEEEISSLRVVQTFHEHLLSHLRALTVLSQIHIVELEHRSISPLHIDTGGLILQSLETERIELPSLVTSLRSIDTGRKLILELLACLGIGNQYVLGLTDTAFALVEGNLHHCSEIGHRNAYYVATWSIFLTYVWKTNLALNLAGHLCVVGSWPVRQWCRKALPLPASFASFSS